MSKVDGSYYYVLNTRTVESNSGRLCFDHTHASPTVRLSVVPYDVFLTAVSCAQSCRVHSRAVLCAMLCAMSPLRVVVRAVSIGRAVRQSVA